MHFQHQIRQRMKFLSAIILCFACTCMANAQSNKLPVKPKPAQFQEVSGIGMEVTAHHKPTIRNKNSRIVKRKTKNVRSGARREKRVNRIRRMHH